jgi:glycolate oxidase FAD binding subunit
MKNVAGYDVSRLIAGAMGTLGVIVEVDAEGAAEARAETTLVFDMNDATAIEAVNKWAGQPLPISATFHAEGRLFVRLSGAKCRRRVREGADGR